MWFIALGLLVGMVAPVQAAMNARLRHAVGSPFGAGFYNFLLGASVLALAALVFTGRLFPAGFDATLHPWWVWIGGSLGMFVMVSNTLLFPALGAMQSVVLANAGLVLTGLVIDHFGWFALPELPLTLPRALGTALVIVGVLAAVGFFSSFSPFSTTPPSHQHTSTSGSGVARTGSSTDAAQPDNSTNAAQPDNTAESDTTNLLSTWLWRLYGVAAGAALALQSAVNGRLTVVMESPIRSAMVSFATGFTLLAIIVLVTHTSLKPKPAQADAATPPATSTPPQSTTTRSSANANPTRETPTRPTTTPAKHPWWMWVGGCLGALLVGTKALLVPEVGAGVTLVVTLAGMTAGSLVIDRFGWLGATKRKATPVQLAGLAAMLIGVGLVRLA